MATTYKGDYKTICDAITPSTVLDPGVMGAQVKVMTDTVTFATATGLPIVADMVELCDELPVGARILEIILTSTDATTTWTLGDYESKTRYLASTTANTTARLTVAGGMLYKVDMTTASTPDNQIVATAVAATVTTGSILQIAVFYTIN